MFPIARNPITSFGFVVASIIFHTSVAVAEYRMPGYIYYTFPTTDYPNYGGRPADGGMAAAFCVLDAADAGARVRHIGSQVYVSEIKYKKLMWPRFADGVETWTSTGKRVKWSNVKGNGDKVCEGGNYIQPSSPYRLYSGRDVVVHFKPEDQTAGSTLCTFIMKPYHGHYYGEPHDFDNSGNWGPLLIEQGFTVSDVDLVAGDHVYTSYCKHFELTASPSQSPSIAPTETASPTDAPTASPSQSTTVHLDLTPTTCEGDVQLTRTDGVTEFPLGFSEDSPIPAINIVEQDSTTVTLELKQAWDGPIDKYFYQYKENLFESKCHEVEGVNPGDLIETITIQCLVMSPIAYLKICLQDTSGNLLGVEDDATVSDCCYSDAPEGTPAVCYQLEIMCESKCNQSPIRNLRAISA